MKTRKPKKTDIAYMLLGKAVVWTSLWAGGVAFTMWALTKSIYF